MKFELHSKCCFFVNLFEMRLIHTMLKQNAIYYFDYSLITIRGNQTIVYLYASI